MAFTSRLQLYSLNIDDTTKPYNFCITENGAGGGARPQRRLIRLIVIKFRYNARADWLKQRTLSE